MVRHLSREQFTQHRKQFKDQASISSASDIIHEITKEQVDRAYKKKAACSQWLTMIFQNWQKEKELAQNELEKEGIDDFYEEYRTKYAAKLLSWQDVIDMYGEQELQKIKEEKEMKEKVYYETRNKERLKQPIMPNSVVGPSDPAQTSVKEFESTRPPTSYVPCIHTETRTVSSSGTVTTPTTLRSQSEIPDSLSIARQRELSQQEALETAAQFCRTVGSEVPQLREGQDTPVSENIVPNVPRNVEQINSLEEQEERSIPVGSVQLTQSSMILAGHPDVMYQNIFPSQK